MSESNTTSTKKLEELIDDDVDPINEPTVIDLINFKKKLGTALTKCKTNDRKKGGHIYLMYDDRQQYADRVGDANADLPSTPTYTDLRVEPTDGSNPISSTEYRIFERKEKLYNEHEDYDRQAQDLLIAKFPKTVEGLRGADGEFDISLTTKLVLTHLTDTLDDAVVVNHCYRDVLLQMLTRDYVTNANGPVEWFNMAEKDRTMSQRLGAELGHEPIPYFLIMTNAQTMFHKSGLPMEQLRKIDAAWKQKALTGSTLTVYKAFKEHYTKELRLLHTDHDNKKGKPIKDKAYTADIAKLERGLYAVKEDIAGLEDRQYDTAVALRSVATKSGSSAGSTATGTTVSDLTSMHEARQAAYVTTDQLDALKQQWQSEVLKTTTKAPTWGSRNDGGWQTERQKARKTWQRYDKYCWSCGVNLSHNSDICKTPAADHQRDAAWTNKKEGSVKNEHRWMWWNSPDGSVVQERN
jgi:hypothetical protein